MNANEPTVVFTYEFNGLGELVKVIGHDPCGNDTNFPIVNTNKKITLDQVEYHVEINVSGKSAEVKVTKVSDGLVVYQATHKIP